MTTTREVKVNLSLAYFPSFCKYSLWLCVFVLGPVYLSNIQINCVQFFWKEVSTCSIDSKVELVLKPHPFLLKVLGSECLLQLGSKHKILKCIDSSKFLSWRQLSLIILSTLLPLKIL